MTRSHWVIALSFVVALMLTLLPLPTWAEYLRPEWVSMVLVYWCIALPHRASVGVGWLLGLFLDVVRGALIGQHALALAVVAYLAGTLHQRLRIFPLWQQSLVVSLLLLGQMLIVVWVNGFAGLPHVSPLYWLPAASSALLWPWTFLILRDLRRKHRLT